MNRNRCGPRVPPARFALLPDPKRDSPRSGLVYKLPQSGGQSLLSCFFGPENHALSLLQRFSFSKMVEVAILNEFAFRKLPAKRSFMIFRSENGGLRDLEWFSVPQNGSEAFLNRIWFTALVQEGFRPNILKPKINAFL